MARLPLGAPSPSGLTLAHPCPRALPSRGSQAHVGSLCRPRPSGAGPHGAALLPTGHRPGPWGSCTQSRLSPLLMQSRGHLAEGSRGASGSGRARRQRMWPSSGGVSDRLAKPPKPPDHRLSLHGGFRVQPGARPGQRGRRVPPPLPLPSASLWAPGGGQRWGGGPACPLGAPRPSPGPRKQPPAWSRSARWCRPGTRAAGSPRSQTGWGHVLSGTRAGLGGPPTGSGAGGGVWGGHSRPSSRVGGPPPPWRCSLNPSVPRSCVLRAAEPVLGEGAGGGGDGWGRGQLGEGSGAAPGLQSPPPGSETPLPQYHIVEN